MRAWGEVWRYWPWSTAWLSGGSVAGILLVLWLTDANRTAGGLIAALMNGVTLFFLVGGVFAALAAAGQGSYLARHPWRFALVPAGVALLILAAMRLSALALNLSGPWRTVPDSLLDVTARAVVVQLIIGIVAVRLGRKDR
ncbi:hypothetical protein ABNF97_14275 [Plantactinospora sp. B6F1]|uniref:hypothetical protein n=1 Tax=Plantactinospora sp. B6F1 TaxID=3158971 RepID=UPI00102CC01E